MDTSHYCASGNMLDLAWADHGKVESKPKSNRSLNLA